MTPPVDPQICPKLSPGVVLADCWNVFDAAAAEAQGLKLLRFGVGQGHG